TAARPSAPPPRRSTGGNNPAATARRRSAAGRGSTTDNVSTIATSQDAPDSAQGWLADRGRDRHRSLLLAQRFLRQLGNAGQRAEDAGGLDRQQQHLLVRRLGHFLQRLDVVVGDEVVQRVHVAVGDRLGHHRGGLGLGLGRAFARLGGAEGGLLLAFGRQDHRLLLALCLEDRGLAETLGVQDVGAFLAL